MQIDRNGEKQNTMEKSILNNKTPIYAGIVLYNPDILRLTDNINAIYPQVDGLIIVDNNSENLMDIKNLLKEFKNVILITNNDNLGIAKALNQIMEVGLNNHVDWILTLDQDSVVSKSLIYYYRKYIDLPNVGMMTCLLKDRNAKGIADKFKDANDDYEEVEKCITSACLTNVAAWDHCGRFDEKMFIDYVDYDLCMTFRENGYRIIRVNQASVLHELGQSKDVRFFTRKYVVSNHSSKRKYFFIRNRLYYNKKHSKILNLKEEYKGMFVYIMLTLLYEPNKFSNFKAMVRGALDSRKM